MYLQAPVVHMSKTYVEVLIESDTWTDSLFWGSLVERVIETVYGFAGFFPPRGVVELSVLLTCDVTITALNRDFRGKDSVTNVLAFPGDGWKYCIEMVNAGIGSWLGDIVIANETAMREAVASSRSLCDHVSHLVVHGVLHLLGYDHRFDAEAEQMERVEVQILGDLGLSNPYLLDGGNLVSQY